MQSGKPGRNVRAKVVIVGTIYCLMAAFVGGVIIGRHFGLF